MRNAEVWTSGSKIRIFHIDKPSEDADRFVTIAHTDFITSTADEQMEIHGRGTINTVLGGYGGYIREFRGPKDLVEAELEKFQQRAQQAGFTRKGMIRAF